MFFKKLNCRFHKENSAWPETIIVFRDGIGDSQLEVNNN